MNLSKPRSRCDLGYIKSLASNDVQFIPKSKHYCVGHASHPESILARMELTKVLAVVAFLASSCAAVAYRRGPECDFTDVTIDDEVFSRLIARFPEDIESGEQGYRSFLLPGLEVGGENFKGLNKLRQFGPAIPYCSRGTRMVQVDFYGEGNMQVWSPWKACWGDQGRITVRATFTRFTFQFRVVESTAAGGKLALERLLPVATQGVHFDVEGAGRGASRVLEVLSYLVPSYAETLWSRAFFRNVNNAFVMINDRNAPKK
ncbi:hypothetical protein MTO96_026324 [Rhipicephalus appendiculatus]